MNVHSVHTNTHKQTCTYKEMFSRSETFRMVPGCEGWTEGEERKLTQKMLAVCEGSGQQEAGEIRVAVKFPTWLTASFLHNAQQAHTCFCWALLARKATMGSWSSGRVSDAHRCALGMPSICFLSQSFPRLPGMTHRLGPVGVGPTWTTLCS